VINGVLADAKHLRPVIILLKYILRERELNETFTGGMSSFLLFCLVFAYHQQLLRKDDFDPDNHDLGQFLLGFLRFYGEEFNHNELGISLRKGGSFFLKSLNKKLPQNNLLSVENFQDVYHDIAKGTYRYESVRSLFRNIYYKFVNAKSSDASVLATMINIKKLK
jgi:non-canonical poly(A) RNA polymerase PAPD5/7